MQPLARISILCVLCVGYIYAQQDAFFEILDFDYGVDLRENDLLKDKDIFKEDTDDLEPARKTEDVIKKLCDEYDIFLDNQNVDCSKLKLAQKVLKTEHVIEKREADEPLEGSGDGGENPPPEYSPKEEAPSQPDELPPPPPPPEGEVNEEPKEEPPQVNIATETPVEDIAPASVAPEEHKEPEPPETATEVPAEEKPTEEVKEAEQQPAVDETPQAGPVEPVPSETATEVPAEENPAATESPKESDDGVATPAVEDAVPEVQQPAVDDVAKENENETTPKPEEATDVAVSSVAGVVKKGRKLVPTDNETDNSDKTQEGASEGNNNKEGEPLHEHQSGNAIVEGAAGNTLEQNEKALNAMSPKANIKTASVAEEPQSGESAKESQEGRKDTKVLIILFVAVVVVGAAAFAYNFIKKRKQKKDQVAREENGDSNPLKRSLQNLSGQTKSDPEQGTEMKPLMKNTAPKPVVTEYKDERENINTEANK